MFNLTDRSLEILEKYYGYKSFRKGQEGIIKSILNIEKDRKKF